MINVCNTAIPKHRISVEDITSDYEFLLPVPSTLTVETEEHYQVTDVKTR